MLPDGLHLKQQSFGTQWMSVENAAPAQLDLAVREAGWHFMWIESACSRIGWGWSDEAAITRAIVHGLMQCPDRFNAAELSFVRVSSYMGIHIAKVTLHTRHIQPSASVGLVSDSPIHQLV